MRRTTTSKRTIAGTDCAKSSHVSEPDPLAPLLGALNDLIGWLNAASVPGAVIGGVAASFLGRPRATRDIDALVVLDQIQWTRFLDTSQAYGFRPRISDALAFAVQARVLLVRHEPSGIDVDVTFGALIFEQETVQRATLTDIAGIRVPLATPEDLVIMKAVAHRPRDLADIESILAARPALDLERVRRWVREFATVLQMPQLIDDLERIIAARAE